MTWQRVMEEIMGNGAMGGGMHAMPGDTKPGGVRTAPVMHPKEDDEEEDPMYGPPPPTIGRPKTNWKEFFVPAPAPQGNYYGPNEDTSLATTAGGAAGRGIGKLLMMI